MKGFVYVLAFFIGFAVGPGSLAPLSSAIAGPQAGSPGQPNRAVETTYAQTVDETDEIAAKVIVEAPTKGRVGELIRFDLTRSEADSIKWIVRPGTPDFEVYEEGRKAVFSARAAGEYLFIIACAKGGSVDVVTHTVKIEGPPPKPESRSLADWVPYWLYPMQLDPDTALKLAESFEEVSDRITALSTPKGIIEATAEANRAALGDELETWKPLLKKIQASLANMARAGTLATPEQHKETWLQIAKGLRKYAS